MVDVDFYVIPEFLAIKLFVLNHLIFDGQFFKKRFLKRFLKR